MRRISVYVGLALVALLGVASAAVATIQQGDDGRLRNVERFNVTWGAACGGSATQTITAQMDYDHKIYELDPSDTSFTIGLKPNSPLVDSAGHTVATVTSVVRNGSAYSYTVTATGTGDCTGSWQSASTTILVSYAVRVIPPPATTTAATTTPATTTTPAPVTTQATTPATPVATPAATTASPVVTTADAPSKPKRRSRPTHCVPDHGCGYKCQAIPSPFLSKLRTLCRKPTTRGTRRCTVLTDISGNGNDTFTCNRLLAKKSIRAKARRSAHSARLR